ncbi:hypothetical protein JVT61DRAFT_6648 [Boletus reticuloceps]|uniref:Uncharacterized protein n=1 Tax=Boletus reticuloceps TaxID=495285 RepID=A0A8I2YLH0_9AGAM|nr:hypothetical protein JVT61DRAFT_6648 [Boletus reticuloceps]
MTIQCHDIDSNAYRSLYDGADDPSFVFVAYTASAADIGGHWAYLLLIINADQEHKFRLLAFRVNDDGFSEPEIMDCINLAPRIFDRRRSVDFRGSAPFITLRHIHPPLVLDHRTRCFYTLPSPQIPDDLAHETQVYSTMRRPWYTHAEIVLTKTHIIAVWTGGPSSNVTVLIRAFIVPDSALPHNIGELRLTHEVIIHEPSYLYRSSLLRNSIVNPVTGSVNIRLLNVTIPRVGHEQKHMSCLDLTLLKPVSNTNVLPISVHTQHLFESTWTYERHLISDDGYGLGLLLTETWPRFVDVNSARKFTIDASKEECSIAVGDACPIYLPVEMDFHVAFDGTRGRLHYFQWSGNDDVNRVVTVDLA